VLASELLRESLLAGVALLVAPATESDASAGGAVHAACAELGANVHTCVCDLADEQALDLAVVELGEVDVLVVDGAELLRQGGLHACLAVAWNVTRAVVNRAFLPAARRGRVIYLAPAPDTGEHAQAACAGLENLARTLSVEWARHGITLVTIAPGTGAAAGEVAALTAYLASPAGAYFSGCLLDLRGAGAGC
jgi:NAD(P)-dependent dehydrogenase (short-subunit alcohol dehydrogenase family)